VSKLRAFLLGIAGIGVVGVAAVSWIIGGPDATDFAGGTKTSLSSYRGGDPTGVPAALKQAGVVERGEYLARASDCLVCHTAPGGKVYAGGVAFVLPFGALYSTNITPDTQTGIGNYTDREFLDAVQRGIRRDGAHLYPAMPFTSYTSMTDADVLAIKAYLFSLPAVEAPAKDDTLSFPFDRRSLIGIWAALFNSDRRFEPNESKTAEWNRGAYIAEALAHCGECHTPRNVFFAVDNRQKFAGAMIDGWRAFNITSDSATGVGAWKDDELFAYLSTGHSSGHGTAAGPMAEAVDESLRHMSPEDIRALTAYVRSVPPAASSDLLVSLTSVAPESHRAGGVENPLGKQIFEGACVGCHSWNGTSPVTPFATLTGSRGVNDPASTNVVQAVISGVERPAQDGALSMPAFGDAYSDADIAAVANYVTGRFGTRASSLTEKDVADLRRQNAG
jgi:mono/diheme cytochrome c family protein